MFRKFDVHKYGYINREQFIQLLDLIDRENFIDREMFLEKIDVNNNDVITFNQLIVLFQNEQIQNKDENIVNLLHHCYSI